MSKEETVKCGNWFQKVNITFGQLNMLVLVKTAQGYPIAYPEAKLRVVGKSIDTWRVGRHSVMAVSSRR